MTVPPDLSPDEAFRLKALRDLNLVETSLDERFERVTRLAKRILRVDIVAISLVEADRQFFKSIQGLDVCETSRDVSFCGHTILGEDLLLVPDAQADERFATNPLVTGAPFIRSYAAVPLRSEDGQKVGTLCAIACELRVFDEEDLQSLRDLASMAQLELRAASANAVQAALLEEVSAEHRRALIDPLTRLWNRDGILRLAADSLEATRGSDAGMALVVVDLDQFKPINDTHGHAIGDDVLRAAGRRMLAALRETDVVGRIGGDEFLCVLYPCDSAESAHAVTERVRSRIAAFPVRTDAGEISVRASLGVCFVDGHTTMNVEQIVEAADAAMYACKREGRDGVHLVEDRRKAS